MRFNSQHAPRVEPPIIFRVPHGPKPFSTFATVVYTLIVVGVLLYATREYWATGSRLESLWYPAETANSVVTANMLVYEGIQRLPPALKQACTIPFADADNLPRDCARILRETIAFVSTNETTVAQLRAQLAVLLAETGSQREAIRAVEMITDTNAFYFRQAFHALYSSNSTQQMPALADSQPFEYVQSSWSAWRFETRWQQATGATWDADWNDKWIGKRARQKALVVLFVSGLDLLTILTGLGLLAWLLQTGLRALFDRRPDDHLSFGEGFGIFIRAELCGWLLILLWSLHSWSSVPGMAYGLWGAVSLLLILAVRRWRRGDGSFATFVGVPHRTRDWWTLFGAAICIVAIDVAAGIAIHSAAVAMGSEGHWTEGLDETLIQDTWPMRLMVFANGVLWSPIYEELAFRGVLFRALKSRLGVFWGALVSAVMFSSLHFYGLQGFLSVAVFGFINALVFHYTRSLIPCIAAHVFVNLLIMGTELALFL